MWPVEHRNRVVFLSFKIPRFAIMYSTSYSAACTWRMFAVLFFVACTPHFQ